MNTKDAIDMANRCELLKARLTSDIALYKGMLKQAPHPKQRERLQTRLAQMESELASLINSENKAFLKSSTQGEA